MTRSPVTPSPSQTPAGHLALLPDDPLFTGHEIADIVATDKGYVAVGYVYVNQPADMQQGAAWRSEDGRHWQPSGAWPGDSRLSSVAAIGDQVVAFGQNAGDPVAWILGDGDRWERVELPAPEEGRFLVVDAAAGPAGVIAIGIQFLGGERLGIAPIWHSLDGRMWSSIDSPNGDVAELHSLAATPDGFAIGDVDHLWIGPGDGTWRSSGPLPGAEGQVIGLLASVGTVLFAGAGEGRTSLWLSDAGGSWSAVEIDGDLNFVSDLAGVDGGYVAVGRSALDGQPIVVLTSVDGLVWTRAPDRPEYHQAVVKRLAVRGDQVVGIGNRTSGAAVFVGAASVEELTRP